MKTAPGKGAKTRTSTRIRSSLLAILSSCISCTLLFTLKFAYKSRRVIFDEDIPYRVTKFLSNKCFWSVARKHHICPFLRHAYYHWFKSAYLSIRGLSSWFCFLRVVEPLDFHYHIAATPLPHALDPTNIRKIEIFCWVGHENCAITDLSINSSHFVIQR